MSEPAFSNIKAVHAHLANLGYKRGQSTIYQDAQNGLLRPTGPGGVYTLDDVERYIKAARIKKPGEIPTDAYAALVYTGPGTELELAHGSLVRSAEVDLIFGSTSGDLQLLDSHPGH